MFVYIFNEARWFYLRHLLEYFPKLINIFMADLKSKFIPFLLLFSLERINIEKIVCQITFHQQRIIKTVFYLSMIDDGERKIGELFDLSLQNDVEILANRRTLLVDAMRWWFKPPTRAYGRWRIWNVSR